MHRPLSPCPLDPLQGALDSSRVALESPIPTVRAQDLAPGQTAAPGTELLGGPGFRGEGIEAVSELALHACMPLPPLLHW